MADHRNRNTYPDRRDNVTFLPRKQKEDTSGRTNPTFSPSLKEFEYPVKPSAFDDEDEDEKAAPLPNRVDMSGQLQATGGDAKKPVKKAVWRGSSSVMSNVDKSTPRIKNTKKIIIESTETSVDKDDKSMTSSQAEEALADLNPKVTKALLHQIRKEIRRDSERTALEVYETVSQRETRVIDTVLEEKVTTLLDSSTKVQNQLQNTLEKEAMAKPDYKVMTSFSCQWFVVLAVFHLAFYFLYFILRKGTSEKDPPDDDDEATALFLEQESQYQEIIRLSIYASIYMFICIWDIFWTCVTPDRVRCERTTEFTHVIVAAHRAATSLEEMLPTVLQTFAPSCIWVADNGYRDQATELLCQRLGVNYEYNPVGNKANALLVVAKKIHREYGGQVKNGESICFRMFSQ